MSQIVETFTIITTAANEQMKPLHDRIPVIVQPNHYDWWLFDDALCKSVLNRPQNDALKIYPVSPLVNSPRNADARCIEPVRGGGKS